VVDDERTVSSADTTDFGVERLDVGSSVPVLALHGQADLHTAPALRDALTQAIDDGAPGLVVDLSEATFIDSMALGVMLGAVKRLRPSGGRLAIVCRSPHIRRIFEITLLDRVFAMHETLESAVAAAEGRADA
jgi:anti-sigma B factor antagonist